MILISKYFFLPANIFIYKNKKEFLQTLTVIFIMARPRGVEPLTFWSVVKRSIQLSYGRYLVGA